MEHKQMIVLRKDLNMRKGKMIAQGAHASLKVLLDRGALDQDGYRFTVTEPMLPRLSVSLGSWVRAS